MLEGKLYHLEDLQINSSDLQAEISLNAEHDIFKGHFPDVPVLPGVTMMHMVKELMQKAMNTPLIIKRAGQLKFMQMVNPQQTRELTVSIKYEKSEEGIKLNASMNKDEVIFFKMSAVLI